MSGPNLQQKAVIEELAGDVSVSAGAGTGKTYTLTRRIVFAVLDFIKRGEVSPLPIHRIVAITYTRAAAAELKSRVRSALSAEAKTSDARSACILEQCALEVDNAWISTIHAMAARVLRENALAFGIDPDFDVISSTESAAFDLKAMEAVLKEAEVSEDSEVLKLASKYPVSDSAGFTPSVLDLTSALLERAKTCTDGLDALRLFDSPTFDATGIESVCEQASLLLSVIDEGEWSGRDSKALPDLKIALEKAICDAREWIASHQRNLSLKAVPEDAFERYTKLLLAFPPTTNKFGATSDECSSICEDYRHVYKKASKAVREYMSNKDLKTTFKLAKATHDELTRLKSAGAGALDSDDLLARCCFELSREENSQIVKRYNRRFVYVMVDEFQDTDRLQMKLISLLMGPPKSALETDGFGGLCTVGDVQQSIYRFRGADVDVSIERNNALTKGAGKVLSLNKNYRSHRDILAGVEEIFSRPQVFGKSFLKLEAAREEKKENALWIDELKTRVNFEFIHTQQKNARANIVGVSSHTRTEIVAKTIAEHFSKLHKSGVSPSKMALLLGQMHNSDIYSEALRSVGLESVITKGSVFSETQESSLVLHLLKFAADPKEERSLLYLLTSQMFSISDDVLLCLVRPKSTKDASKKYTKVPLCDAFLYSDETTFNDELPKSDVAGFLHAKTSLLEFRKLALAGNVECALRKLLNTSGLLYRLESSNCAESLASAGNLAKALRIVVQLEPACMGISSLSRAFENHLFYEKEPPGSLSTSNSQFVQIMTVHSSKGLEFDHVVIADLKGGASLKRVMTAENLGESIYASIKPSERDFPSKSAYDNYSKVMKFDDCEDFDQGYFFEDANALDVNAIASLIEESSVEDRFDILSAYTQKQELAEARRLLYVALTRAKESVLLIHAKSGKVSDGCYKGIYDDVYSALCDKVQGLSDSADDVAIYSDNVSVKRTFVTEEVTNTLSDELASEENISSSEAPALQCEESASENDTFQIPVYNQLEVPHPGEYSVSNLRLSSYTALSAFESQPFVQKGAPNKLPLDELLSDGVSSENDQGAAQGGEALALGDAFHNVARAMLCSLNSASLHACDLDSTINVAIENQSSKYSLSQSQNMRLKDAVNTLKSSHIFTALMSYEVKLPEAPFCAPVEIEPASYVSDAGIFSVIKSAKISLDEKVSFTLEGAFDVLAYNTLDEACVIDYKTGHTSSLDEAYLKQKHLFQAQCYAYALLKNGFSNVAVHFVRVEDTVNKGEGAPEPLVVSYHFSLRDILPLKDTIALAWLYSIT